MARQGGNVQPILATFEIQRAKGDPGSFRMFIDTKGDDVSLRMVNSCGQEVEFGIAPEMAPLFRMISNRLDNKTKAQQNAVS